MTKWLPVEIGVNMLVLSPWEGWITPQERWRRRPTLSSDGDGPLKIPEMKKGWGWGPGSPA